MFHKSIGCVVACAVLSLCNSRSALASDPATPSLAAIDLHHRFYVDFARALDAIDAEIALAERTVAILRTRVAGYRPFRSFHQYGATYTVDQGMQLELLAAEQRITCLRTQRNELWHARQMAAYQLMQSR
jgi:hypothetical protein